MKMQYLLWYFVTFVLNCAVYLIDGYYFLKNRTNTRRELKAFITHCQRLPPRKIPFPKINEEINVSIIIPVYNQWHLTRACLNSILETCNDSINYEIILADDCSTDETINAREEYPGLIIVKTEQNLGFLQNCNNAAKHARGQYILLLNNDTIVLPNWLNGLSITMKEDDSAAIVGSKILHPTGKIQEAGVTVFNNASVRKIGNKRHRQTPRLNIQRETDYISGCSILIRKSFWDSVRGFDERYCHAYFEDNDLAMTARAHNMKVIYQPKSELVHFQRKTYGFKKKNQYKLLFKTNKKLFLEKWKHVLESRHRVF